MKPLFLFFFALFLTSSGSAIAAPKHECGALDFKAGSNTQVTITDGNTEDVYDVKGSDAAVEQDLRSGAQKLLFVCLDGGFNHKHVFVATHVKVTN